MNTDKIYLLVITLQAADKKKARKKAQKKRAKQRKQAGESANSQDIATSSTEPNNAVAELPEGSGQQKS